MNDRPHPDEPSPAMFDSGKYIKMNKIEALEKQKVYLQEQLRKAGQEIKELRDDNKKLSQQIGDRNKIYE
jgi:predicted  nucleic acid-binding Zn-ribbon protein|tara:strand:+ start:46 stop:255 length:210 start_codon:yes stop_codon:yes gene_type:complete